MIGASRVLVLAALALAAALAAAPGPAQQRDYLTGLEADRIREAETPSERIKLFLAFAADRLKKFQYEMGRPTADRRKAERLNDLLNAYGGCVDDAAELVELGIEKSQDIRDGVKELKGRSKEFLAYLEKLAASGEQAAPFKDALDDAIEATRDAQKDAEKAEKEMSTPPVRRKP